MNLNKIKDNLDGLLDLMTRKETLRSTIVRTKNRILDFINYCEEGGVENINDEIIESYYIKTYNKRTIDLKATLTRPLAIMSEYYQTGDYCYSRKRNQKYKLNQVHSSIISEFRVYLSNKYKNPFSLEWGTKVFLTYLENHGKTIFDIDESYFIKFLSSSEIIKAKSFGDIRKSLKLFCKYINYTSNNTVFNLNSIFMKAKSKNRSRLISYFTVEEVNKILTELDISNKTGKFMYAILSIVIYLGLRIGDVIKLKMDNLDFTQNKLILIQSKTQNYLELPLIDEVKYPLIDYIVNARPNDVETDTIFLTRERPYREYKNGSSIYITLQMYLNKIGIDCKNRRTGLHALRHSLATNMLSNNTSLEVIGSVLGHTTSNVTRRYISTDINKLKKLTLEVPYVLPR